MIHRFGRFELRPDARLLLEDGRAVDVGARAFDLLQALVERRDRVVAKAELLDLAWPGVIVEENNLQVQVSTLRKILGADAIKTVPGRGYRFTLEAQAADAPETSVATAPDTLPRPLTRFIGRERDLARYAGLLEGTRLLTLTGVGGSGKTRVAIELAREVLPQFPDGVGFVDLAPVGTAERVASAVASALGVREEPDRPVLATLGAQLAGRRMLVVLDNCDHVLAACAAVAESLLAHGDAVRMLATSRERLGVAGEQVAPVHPLDVAPESADRTAREASAAVRLFVDRARLAAPDFVLDERALGTVEDICRRLEGLPLAIELAAARVKLLSLADIQARLADRFRLLVAQGRSLQRHQTLRGVIEWSYEQLDPRERQAFRALSVFTGGWTLDAATAVTACSDDFVAIDTLSRLVDKSLVLVERHGETPRYRMLETVRTCAGEQLDASGEAPAARARHLHHFLAVVEALPPSRTLDEIPAFERLDAEFENVMAAYEECKRRPRMSETGLRLAIALRRYLVHRGHVRLARGLVEDWLDRPETRTPDALQARALAAAGQLAEESGDARAAALYLMRALDLARATGDTGVQVSCLRYLGSVARTANDLAVARTRLEECLALARQLGDPFEIASALNDRGEVCRMEDDLDGATSCYDEALGILRQHALDPINTLLNLAIVANERRDFAMACRYLQEAVAETTIRRSRYFEWCVLQHAAALGALDGDAAFAARTWGAFETMSAATGLALQRADIDFLTARIEQARLLLGEQAFDEARAAGRRLSADGAMAEVAAWLERHEQASTTAREASDAVKS